VICTDQKVIKVCTFHFKCFQYY